MVRPVPGLSIEQQSSNVLTRMLVWGEARGESPVGRLAVLYVAYNRAKRSGKGITQEILKPLQFSCFNEHDPNRSKLLEAYAADSQAWAICDVICELFENLVTMDPTKGATHYYVLEMDHPPVWGRGHSGWDERAVIGHHVFGVAK